MYYSDLVEIYEKLEGTSSKLEKTDIITGFLSKTSSDLLYIVPPLLMGRIFPDWSSLELGIGPGMLYDAIVFVTGVTKDELNATVKEEGDIGLAAEKLFMKKVQSVLFKQRLSLDKVYGNFEKIAGVSGAGAQSRKVKLLSELLTSASPKEAKYIARTVLGELRVGVAEGLVRDAIAQSFKIPKSVVERAYMLTNDFGKVAHTARMGGENGLKKLSMSVGVPLKPMLA
ncbi:MAG: DNA ligase, partial [Candidatus Hydrothermarchaeaceae archaeon]